MLHFLSGNAVFASPKHFSDMQKSNTSAHKLLPKLGWAELKISMELSREVGAGTDGKSSAVKTGEQMLPLGESCSAFGLLPVMTSLRPDRRK